MRLVVRFRNNGEIAKLIGLFIERPELMFDGVAEGLHDLYESLTPRELADVLLALWQDEHIPVDDYRFFQMCDNCGEACFDLGLAPRVLRDLAVRDCHYAAEFMVAVVQNDYFAMNPYEFYAEKLPIATLSVILGDRLSMGPGMAASFLDDLLGGNDYTGLAMFFPDDLTVSLIRDLYAADWSAEEIYTRLFVHYYGHPEDEKFLQRRYDSVMAKLPLQLKSLLEDAAQNYAAS